MAILQNNIFIVEDDNAVVTVIEQIYCDPTLPPPLIAAVVASVAGVELVAHDCYAVWQEVQLSQQ